MKYWKPGINRERSDGTQWHNGEAWCFHIRLYSQKQKKAVVNKSELLFCWVHFLIPCNTCTLLRALGGRKLKYLLFCQILANHALGEWVFCRPVCEADLLRDYPPLGGTSHRCRALNYPSPDPALPFWLALVDTYPHPGGNPQRGGPLSWHWISSNDGTILTSRKRPSSRW